MGAGEPRRHAAFSVFSSPQKLKRTDHTDDASLMSIRFVGYYWAMQNANSVYHNNTPTLDGRNCTANCSWDHANTAMVQNSWLNPDGTRAGSTKWDISDIRQLASHGVTAIVSVSHVFTTGPTGSLYPDFERRWAQ
jgi:hypothetical protein